MLDGQKVDPIGVGGARTVRHGLGGARSAMLYRLAEPPTALDLIAIANALTRGAIETPAIGDVTLFGDRQLYIELVCPVDLLVVTVGKRAEGKCGCGRLRPS